MNLEEAELEEQTTVAGTVMVLDVFLPHLFLNAEQANAAFFGDISMGPKNVGRGTCEMALIVFFFATTGYRSWGDFLAPSGLVKSEKVVFIFGIGNRERRSQFTCP